MHLNAVYDLLARTYVDAIIQPARQENENKAMCDMIDRYQGNPKDIFIADRGYENYNIFAHAQEKGMFYYEQKIFQTMESLLPCIRNCPTIRIPLMKRLLSL